MTALTVIRNPDTFQTALFRPFPVNRLDINVGERPIAGIPYLRDSNFRAMDVDTKFSRDSKFFYGRGVQNTARLGQSLPSLPDRRDTTMSGGACDGECKCETPVVQEGSGNYTCEQCGGNALKRLGKFVKGVAKKTKGVAKVVKGVAKVVAPVAGVAGKVVGVFKPEWGKALETVSKGAEATGKFAAKVQNKSRSLQRDAREVQRQGRREEAEKAKEQEGSGMGRVAELMATKGGTIPGPRGGDRQSFVPTHPMNFNKAKLTTI